MSKIIIGFFIIFISFLTKAQTSEERKVDEFTSIEASSGVNIIFTQEAKTAVIVKIKSNKPSKKIITKTVKGVLKVYIEKSKSKEYKEENIEILISSPHLTKINADAGVSFNTSNTVKESNLELNLNDGVSFAGIFVIKNSTKANINSGVSLQMNLTTNSLDLISENGVSFRLRGKASSANLKLANAVSFNAMNFEVKTANVKVDNASSLKILVADELNATAENASTIVYKGNPKVTQKVGQTSSITKE